MKVLFLDSWTKGIHNFLPIAKRLKKYGHDSLLVHKGSWGNETDKPAEEIIDGLLCRDTKYYNTRLLYNILLREKPDVAILLTSNNVIDRATILAARALGIKTCFLMHGIRPMGEDWDKFLICIEKNLEGLRWTRAAKYLKYTIPNYLFSGFKYDPSFPFTISPYRLLWKLFKNPVKSMTALPPLDELHCDQALLWAEIYKEWFVGSIGYPESSVQVVGHPPLDQVFKMKTDGPGEESIGLLYKALKINPHEKFALYLEDAFVEQGFTGWTQQERIEFLRQIAQVCKKAERLLVVKLHPLSDVKQDDFSEDDNIKLIKHTNLPLLIHCAESVMGHTSSTVSIAICFEKPVFIPNWGIAVNVPDSYCKMGVAIECNNTDTLFEKLYSPGKFLANKENWANYINKYISHTDGESIKRIVNAIISL